MQLLLVDLQLEAVHALGEPCEPLPQRGLLGAKRRELLVLGRSRGLGLGQCDPSLGDRPVDRVQNAGKLLHDSGCRFALCASDDRPACGLGRGIPLLLALPLEPGDASLRSTTYAPMAPHVAALVNIRTM